MGGTVTLGDCQFANFFVIWQNGLKEDKCMTPKNLALKKRKEIYSYGK